ncbi:hypothetical protein PCE1_002733 [Barthelona sp. PCE]
MFEKEVIDTIEAMYSEDPDCFTKDLDVAFNFMQSKCEFPSEFANDKHSAGFIALVEVLCATFEETLSTHLFASYLEDNDLSLSLIEIIRAKYEAESADIIKQFINDVSINNSLVDVKYELIFENKNSNAKNVRSFYYLVTFFFDNDTSKIIKFSLSELMKFNNELNDIKTAIGLLEQ